MLKRTNIIFITAMVMTQVALGEDSNSNVAKSLTVTNGWTTNVSPDGRFTYSVCPVSDQKSGCRAPSTNTLLRLLKFNRSIPFVPIDQYLSHIEAADVSVKSSAISDSHLIVRYAIKPAPSEQLQRESTAHDTFQSGWLQVSKKNGEQSYLVCPGEIKHLGESEMASAYRCEYAGKIFPLKYLSTSIEELKNKKVLRQHILKVGNTLSVTSAMGFGPFVDSETNYPRLDELIVIDESNETQPSGSFMCLCFLMILLAGCLLKFIAGKVFARFTTPSRLISSQGTMVDSPETLERYSQMRQRIPAVVTSPAERDYEMLSELHRRLHSRSNTEHNAQRIRFLRSHFAASESAYVSNELQYMIDTQRAPRRITESTVTEPQSVSPIARPESINVQVPTSSTKTKRKVYVD